MPGYRVTFLEERKIDIWLPDGLDDKRRTELALDHISWSVLQGHTAKILNLEPSGTLEQITEPTNVAPIK